MSMLRRDKLEIKLGDYAVGDGLTVLTDPHLINRAQDYKRLVASQLRPIDADEIRKKLPPADYHVSLKIDGEFCILVYADGVAFTVNPGGTVRTGLRFMTEAAERLKKAGIKQAILVGELHYDRPDGSRGRVHDVTRVARQPADKAELDGLRFSAFDVLEVDGKPTPPTLAEIRKRIEDLVGGGTRLDVVPGSWVKDPAEIEKHYHKWVGGGAEGIVVRSDAAGRFKVKPRHTLDVAVIGFTESAEADRRGMIHDLLLAVMRADGCFQVLGHVGGGFTDAQRREFLSDLKDMIVQSDYLEVNDQVAYHMVRPVWVVEISVLDMLAQTTRNEPINRMVLHWNTAASCYQIVRRMPLVNLISPIFIRRREDKRVNPTNVRMAQVTDRVEVPLADRDARQVNLAPSKILRREVYTKVLKGQTMVRKFLMWETNKAKETPDFPAFVLHYTDFSPNRRTQLERDIRVSSSRDQIDLLWAEMIAENLAKGWNPVTTGGEPPAPEAAKPTSTEVAVAPAPRKRGKAAPKDEPQQPDPAAETAVAPAPKKRASPRKKSET